MEGIQGIKYFLKHTGPATFRGFVPEIYCNHINVLPVAFIISVSVTFSLLLQCLELCIEYVAYKEV